MTKEEKIIVAKWFITNKLIGVTTEIYNKVKNNEINNLDELHEIIKTKGEGGKHLCTRCIHVSNVICHRCEDMKDSGFRFRYKYYKNRLIEDELWEKTKETFS